MTFLHTYLSHYILSVSFASLPSAIVYLLLQINVHKNMRTALFCAVCALPVFILKNLYKLVCSTFRYILNFYCDFVHSFVSLAQRVAFHWKDIVATK